MWRIGCHVPLPAARLRGNWGRQRRGCDPPRGTNGVLRPRGCPDDGVRGARSGIGARLPWPAVGGWEGVEFAPEMHREEFEGLGVNPSQYSSFTLRGRRLSASAPRHHYHHR